MEVNLKMSLVIILAELTLEIEILILVEKKMIGIILTNVMNKA